MEKNAAESEAASRWYNGMEEAVYALVTYPDIAALWPRKLETLERRSLTPCKFGITFVKK